MIESEGGVSIMKTKNSILCLVLAGVCLIIGGTIKIISSIYEIPKLDLSFGISWILAGIFVIMGLYFSKRKNAEKISNMK